MVIKQLCFVLVVCARLISVGGFAYLAVFANSDHLHFSLLSFPFSSSPSFSLSLFLSLSLFFHDRASTSFIRMFRIHNILSLFLSHRFSNSHVFNVFAVVHFTCSLIRSILCISQISQRQTSSFELMRHSANKCTRKAKLKRAYIHNISIALASGNANSVIK